MFPIPQGNSFKPTHRQHTSYSPEGVPLFISTSGCDRLSRFLKRQFLLERITLVCPPILWAGPKKPPHCPPAELILENNYRNLKHFMAHGATQPLVIQAGSANIKILSRQRGWGPVYHYQSHPLPSLATHFYSFPERGRWPLFEHLLSTIHGAITLFQWFPRERGVELAPLSMAGVEFPAKGDYLSLMHPREGVFNPGSHH